MGANGDADQPARTGSPESGTGDPIRRADSAGSQIRRAAAHPPTDLDAGSNPDEGTLPSVRSAGGGDPSYHAPKVRPTPVANPTGTRAAGRAVPFPARRAKQEVSVQIGRISVEVHVPSSRPAPAAVIAASPPPAQSSAPASEPTFSAYRHYLRGQL
jgi:hypothetical protein